MVKVITISVDVSECIHTMVKEFLMSEEGATAIEYGLLAVLIGATIIGAQTAMGQTVVAMYQTAANTIVAGMGS